MAYWKGKDRTDATNCSIAPPPCQAWNMGITAFHRHFVGATSPRPIQYRKQSASRPPLDEGWRKPIETINAVPLQQGGIPLVWLPAWSAVFAPARFAIMRWAGTGIMWSSVATRYQDGLVFQAGLVTSPFKASSPSAPGTSP